jgi:anti-sigma-K factor RskA
MQPQVSITCDEFIDLAAGYALDALDPSDVERVEQHAATCADCASRLEEFRETAAALGTRVPQADPPAALRGRLLEAVRSTSQERAPEPLRPRPVRRLRWSGAWLVAAASLLISLASIGWMARMNEQMSTLRADVTTARERAARYDHIAEVLGSDQLAIRQLAPLAQDLPYRGLVYLDPLSGTGMLTCHDMPPIEQGRAYQVWFMRGNTPVSAGLVWPDRAGNGYALIQVPSDLQNFDSIGMSEEPGTGSVWPTGQRVIGGPLR